jgi:hypothetical protein
MGELHSYCTVAFRTRKRLYLEFYSTNFDNFFFQILLIVYPTYYKTIKLFGCRGYEVFKQERSKWVLFGAICQWKSLFLSYNFDWIRIILYSHFVAKTFLFLTIYIDYSFGFDLPIKSCKNYHNIHFDHFMSQQIKLKLLKPI